jgi:hypothetical protein
VVLSKLDATKEEIVPLKAIVKKLQDDIAMAVQERDTAVQVQQLLILVILTLIELLELCFHSAVQKCTTCAAVLAFLSVHITHSTRASGTKHLHVSLPPYHMTLTTCVMLHVVRKHAVTTAITGVGSTPCYAEH